MSLKAGHVLRRFAWLGGWGEPVSCGVVELEVCPCRAVLGRGVLGERLVDPGACLWRVQYQDVLRAYDVLLDARGRYKCTHQPTTHLTLHTGLVRVRTAGED